MNECERVAYERSDGPQKNGSIVGLCSYIPKVQGGVK